MCFDWLQRLQAYPGMSLLPVVSAQAWSPGQLEAAAESGFKFYLMAPSLGELRKVARDLVPGFVSSGPVLQRFWGRPFVHDTWEHYLLWQPGDVATIQFELTSAAPLEQVTLMAGERVARRFYPNARHFETEVSLPMAADGPLYLVANDSAGGVLISYALPTRNLNYWNHVGSDRMNDYHNPICRDDQGSIVYNGQRYGFGGLVTLALGWGNYLRFYHPAPQGRYHPQGYETGQIEAGLGNLATYPLLRSRQVPDGEVDPERRLLLATRDVAIVEERFPRVHRLDANGAANYLDITNVEAVTRLVIFRYQYRPYGTITVLGQTTLRLQNDLSIQKAKPDDLAVELVRLDYRGKGKDFRHLIYRDSSGVRQAEPVVYGGKPWCRRVKVGAGGYVTLSPDPFGLLGIHSLDGELEVDVRDQGTPRIAVGQDFADGTKRLRGETFSRRWIVTQDAGGEDPELFERLSALWGLGKGRAAPAYAPAQVESGRVLAEPYVVTLETQGHGCIASFESPEQLPNRMIPVAVRGMTDGWSAGALTLDGEKPVWYPGGVLEGTLWLGLESAGRYFLGQPLVCDQPDVQLEIRAIATGEIQFTLHNPQAAARDVTVTAAPALPGTLKSQRFSLGKGAVITASAKWSLPR